MADPTEQLADTVTNAAQAPSEISVAGMGFTKEQPLRDIVEAAKFNPSTAVKTRVGGGMRFTVATAGGPVR